jgi:hypothetical protein
MAPLLPAHMLSHMCGVSHAAFSNQSQYIESAKCSTESAHPKSLCMNARGSDHLSTIRPCEVLFGAEGERIQLVSHIV